MNNVICVGDELPDDSGNPLPQRRHVGDGFSVKSQLTLGVEPSLYLSWAVDAEYWARGHTLMVFHSTTTFCPDRYPDDLNKHGRMVIETVTNSSREERLTEGTHFYTFVLHKPTWHGLTNDVSVVRLSETVPTAKIGIGRIRDQMELQDLKRKHELGPIEHETRVNEAEVRRIRSRQKLEQASGTAKSTGGAGGYIAQELAAIDAMLATGDAKRRKIESLRKDERFLALSQDEQNKIISRIEERLDAGEISAREEIDES